MRRSIAPELRQQIVDSVAGEASGNPFFAVELVQHFLDMVDPDGAPSTSAKSNDYRLDGMILKRVGGLPEEAQRMLEIVAVARDPLAQRTLASAVDVTFGSDALGARNLGAGGRPTARPPRASRARTPSWCTTIASQRRSSPSPRCRLYAGCTNNWPWRLNNGIASEGQAGPLLAIRRGSRAGQALRHRRRRGGTQQVGVQPGGRALRNRHQP